MATLTAYANSYAADGSLGAWTSPTNAYSDDGSYATRAGTSKSTWYGNLFGFDLSSIPAGATINSATLEAQWKNSAADTAGPEFFLSCQENGSAIGSGTTDTSGQRADETVTYAPTLTAAQLKSSSFYAIVRFRRTDNTTHTASLDYVKITVNYSVVHVLAVNDAAHALTSDTVTLTQVHTLGISDSSHALASEEVALTQAHALAVSDASHALASETVALAQTHILGVSDTSHALASDTVSLTQVHILAVADSTHPLTSDTVTLSSESAADLAIADASHGLTSEQVALSQVHVLGIADAVDAVYSDTVTLTQTHMLAIADSLHALTSDTVRLGVLRGLLKVHTAVTSLGRSVIHTITRSSVTRRR